MNQFEFTVRESEGLHARPAGMITKAAKQFGGGITISKGGKSVDARKMFALMGLGIKSGDTITVSSENSEALAEMKKIMDDSL